ncbi:MAG: helix-turn-helix domain-containing protein [Desulfatiglandaceae bacterium]
MHRINTRQRESKDGYSIGEVSGMVGLSQKTLRDYEKVGLLRPGRQPRTNNRIYTDYEVDQIERISVLMHEEGFTLPCLVRLLQLAPCWNIFDCEIKTRCNAYLKPHEPCYVVRGEHGTLCDGTCEQCAVYLNRTDRGGKLLSRPAVAC